MPVTGRPAAPASSGDHTHSGNLRADGAPYMDEIGVLAVAKTGHLVQCRRWLRSIESAHLRLTHGWTDEQLQGGLRVGVAPVVGLPWPQRADVQRSRVVSGPSNPRGSRTVRWPGHATASCRPTYSPHGLAVRSPQFKGHGLAKPRLQLPPRLRRPEPAFQWPIWARRVQPGLTSEARLRPAGVFARVDVRDGRPAVSSTRPARASPAAATKLRR
jgi:hypothetical protein